MLHTADTSAQALLKQKACLFVGRPACICGPGVHRPQFQGLLHQEPGAESARHRSLHPACQVTDHPPAPPGRREGWRAMKGFIMWHTQVPWHHPGACSGDAALRPDLHAGAAAGAGAGCGSTRLPRAEPHQREPGQPGVCGPPPPGGAAAATHFRLPALIHKMRHCTRSSCACSLLWESTAMQHAWGRRWAADMPRSSTCAKISACMRAGERQGCRAV